MTRNFKKAENEIQLLACPFSFDAEKAPDNLLLELNDFQSDKGLKMKFSPMKCDSHFVPETSVSKTLERRCYQFLRPHTTLSKLLLSHYSLCLFQASDFIFTHGSF
jgi:hypothetical protein